MNFAKSFRPWLAGSLLLATVMQPVAAKTVPTLKVANVQQLLQALGPDRTIQLQPGIYHLGPELASTPYAGPKAPGLATLLIPTSNAKAESRVILLSARRRIFRLAQRLMAPCPGKAQAQKQLLREKS